jgi:hypothetical protein
MIHSQYSELRNMAFSFAFQTDEQTKSNVKVLIADWHRENGIISLIITDDGAVSLHFSSGTSILGCGKFPSVTSAANKLMQLASQYYHEGKKVSSNTLPALGELQFYLRTVDALHWLHGGSDPSKVSSIVIELFKAMNEVISCIRETNTKS